MFDKRTEAGVSLHELWVDLINSVTTRHLDHEVTLDGVLESLTETDRYIIDKIVRNTPSRVWQKPFTLRDVIEVVAGNLVLPSPICPSHVYKDEIVPLGKVTEYGPKAPKALADAS